MGFNYDTLNISTDTKTHNQGKQALLYCIAKCMHVKLAHIEQLSMVVMQ